MIISLNKAPERGAADEKAKRFGLKNQTLCF